MDAGQGNSGLAFRAFLSHRYKSPEVNEFFSRILSASANPQFAVDQGTISTSVTRLERLVRNADAFIGIYAFPEGVEPTVERLRRESQYFRLELGLAERAAKPALVFIDSRFGNVINPAPETIQVRYRGAEVTSDTQSPRVTEFEDRVTEFYKLLGASRAYQASWMRGQEEKTKVGLLLPRREGASLLGYTDQHLGLIESEIKKSTPRDVEIFRWPPVLDAAFAARLAALDWIVVDVGPDSAACGIIGYLHGRFIPMMRLLQVPEIERPSPLIDTLYGAYEVGYPKDIVRWGDETALQTEIDRRIAIIEAQQLRVAGLADAQRYFRNAALRNEAVFVSYSGDDADIAKGLVNALKERFQKVFDYRDAGQSILAGTPWLAEIFKQLATSPIGVPLYSPSYFESGNCLHEAREMLACRDAGRMKMIPVKLKEGDLAMPAEFSELQYLRFWEYRTPVALADAIVEAIGR